VTAPGASEVALRPRGPYVLADSAGRPDPTRSFRGGVLDLVLPTAAGTARIRVWQRRDGELVARVAAPETAAAVDALRFVLALDVDHSPFLRLAAADPLLRDAVRRRPGRRPARLGTVAHALVRAVCGQLITAHEAMRIERRVLRAVCAPAGELRRPPAAADLARLSAAHAERAGLSPRRAAALVRVARTLDLERLRTVPAQAAVARLLAEPGLGPWSAGVIAGQGLGSYAHGPVGDLGLIKLCSSVLGRRADVADTAALLDRYGEWGGLAAAHLLHHPFAHDRAAYHRAAYARAS
jgi:AraC family transcriptional regulator of adaptative response / DNA-3-methyladenine glycosylase II